MLIANYPLTIRKLNPIREAITLLEQSSNENQRGAVYTRPEVVDFILDLTGYTLDKPLHNFTLLEPSIGNGDFLFPAIKRLITAWKGLKRDTLLVENDIGNAILAVELHLETFDATHSRLVSLLQEEGFLPVQAKRLADKWLLQGDFLLLDIRRKFDFVIGNPPYVRQELIPDALVIEYRKRYKSFYDRADLYVPFIERALGLMNEKGNLGYICSDRWMKNKYGGPLRSIIADSFYLKYYVDMVDTPAFQNNVIAYPAITIITREKTKRTRIAQRPDISKKAFSNLASILASQDFDENNSTVKELTHLGVGEEPWILESSDQLTLVRKLESTFPLLEDADCKVGIGVATGADKVFIAPFDSLEVEDNRKLPLVTTKDIVDNKILWTGLGIINPFTDDGKLVNLNDFPKLKNYLYKHRTLIKSRHVALKNPDNWYRTIDKIYPCLTFTKKLLIPDIKGDAHIVYEDGKLYPHHNLYYITSNSWDLKALQAVLRSGIARLFISIYSTRMRGGYFRFQAQYLRRIRIPKWNDVSSELKNELISAVERNDANACNTAVFKLYNLNNSEREAIGGNGE